MKQTDRQARKTCRGGDRACGCKSVRLAGLKLGTLLSAPAPQLRQGCTTVPALSSDPPPFLVISLLGFGLTSPMLAGHRMTPASLK